MNNNSLYIGINLYININQYMDFNIYIDPNIYMRINTGLITINSYQMALIPKFEIASIFLST